MKLNIQLFASGTIPRTSAPSNGDIQIVWSSTPSGSAENYSTVTASVQVKRRSSGETTGTFSGYLQIDNESVSVKKKFSPLKNEWKTVGTFTKTINHNQDGTKSIVIGAYLEQTGTSLAGDYEASSTVNLDTINRISPVSTVSSADMNTTITINTNRYASFTHTIRYVFGGASGTIATNVGDSTTWAIPITLANQIPNSVKSVGTIYCDTYNGSTYIGTSSQEIVLSVPSSVVPSVSFTMTKGGNTSLNAWVQNKSQAIINITASGSYGSSITSYSINGDGYTYNVNPTTTNTLRATGNQTFYVTVTDSRGRTATTTQTIYVEPYSMPTISTAQVQRCNQDGTLNDNGDYCYYVFNGSISSVNSLNKTNTTYKIGYKLSTDANYTYITIDSNKDSITSSGVLSSGGTEIQFNSSNTYDIQFTIEDTYSTSANTIQLTSGFDLMNFNASGKSMAVGMVSQRTANEECLDIALDTNIYGNLSVNGDIISPNVYMKPICSHLIYYGSHQFVKNEWRTLVETYGLYHGWPEPPAGFSRWFRFNAWRNDNATSDGTALVVGLFDIDGNYASSINFDRTWGSGQNEKGAYVLSQFMTYDEINIGWTTLKTIIAGSSDGTQGYLFTLSMEAFDIPTGINPNA